MKKLDGRTKAYRDYCNKIATEGKTSIIDFNGKTISGVCSKSNFDNSFIGSGAPHRCDTLKALIKRGITEQIQARLLSRSRPPVKPRDASKSPSQIGFNPKKKMWFGWSHRAIAGFKIGDTSSRGSVLKKCQTLEDCKEAASDFAQSVS